MLFDVVYVVDVDDVSCHLFNVDSCLLMFICCLMLMTFYVFDVVYTTYNTCHYYMGVQHLLTLSDSGFSDFQKASGGPSSPPMIFAQKMIFGKNF